MELADLKTIWDQATADISTNAYVDEGLVDKTIRKRSVAELSKIKRGFFLKFTFATVVILICASSTIMTLTFPEEFNPLGSFFSPLETTIFYATMTFSLAAMLWFNHRAYRRLKALEGSSDNLKKYLHQFISSMESAIRFNIYSDTFMSPIMLTWIFYVYAFKVHPLALNQRFVLLFILPLVIGTFAYFFQRFSQKLKFGRYVNRLKAFLDELNQE